MRPQRSLATQWPWQVPASPSPTAAPKGGSAPVVTAPAVRLGVGRSPGVVAASRQARSRRKVLRAAPNGLLRPQQAAADGRNCRLLPPKRAPAPARWPPSLLCRLRRASWKTQRPLLILIDMRWDVLLLAGRRGDAVLLYHSGRRAPVGNHYWRVDPTTRPPKRYTKTNAKGEPVDFRDFLAKTMNDERIVLQDDVETGPVIINQRNLTIEAAGDKEITWRFLDKGSSAPTMIVMNNAEGTTLQGVTLDGGDRAKTLINLYGRSPGLTLRNLQLKNFKEYGVHVTNCEGSSKKPIQIGGLTFEMSKPEQIGIYFDILEHSRGTVPVDRYFGIHDCKFNGPWVPGKLAVPRRWITSTRCKKSCKRLLGRQKARNAAFASPRKRRWHFIDHRSSLRRGPAVSTCLTIPINRLTILLYPVPLDPRLPPCPPLPFLPNHKQNDPACRPPRRHRWLCRARNRAGTDRLPARWRRVWLSLFLRPALRFAQSRSVRAQTSIRTGGSAHRWPIWSMRWQGISNCFLHDPDFGLRLADRLQKAHASNREAEKTFAGRVGALSADDAERERKKMEGERNYIQYLSACLGNFIQPIGVPILILAIPRPA